MHRCFATRMPAAGRVQKMMPDALETAVTELELPFWCLELNPGPLIVLATKPLLQPQLRKIWGEPGRRYKAWQPEFSPQNLYSRRDPTLAFPALLPTPTDTENKLNVDNYFCFLTFEIRRKERWLQTGPRVLTWDILEKRQRWYLVEVVNGVLIFFLIWNNPVDSSVSCSLSDCPFFCLQHSLQTTCLFCVRPKICLTLAAAPGPVAKACSELAA